MEDLWVLVIGGATGMVAGVVSSRISRKKDEQERLTTNEKTVVGLIVAVGHPSSCYLYDLLSLSIWPRHI